MNNQKSYFPCIRPLAAAVLLGFASLQVRAEEKADLRIGGAGWMQYGIIGKSSDTVGGRDFNGKSIYSSGAQIQAHAKLSEHFEGQAGLGVVLGHTLIASPKLNSGYAPTSVFPYVSEGNFTYTAYNEERAKFFVRAGMFDFNYNPNVANLGLYLLRGPLFPGILISGFENRFTAPVANTLGLQIHHQSGAFDQDLLVTSETEYFPYFDISPAYLAGIQAGSVLHLGAGVQFHHLISIEDSLTSGDWHPERYRYIDTVTHDTTMLTFRGIRLMANASLDFKALFGGSDAFTPSDLIFYTEVALMGLNNGPAYKNLYGGYKDRMPIMFGFNVPTARFLDRLALEVEYYGAPFEDDLKGFNHTASSIENPLPPKDETGKYPVIKKDNWKWSLYGSRVIQDHFRVSAQVANDHFRPGIYTGDGDNAPPGSESVMQSMKDWYFMSKVAYFF